MKHRLIQKIRHRKKQENPIGPESKRSMFCHLFLDNHRSYAEEILP